MTGSQPRGGGDIYKDAFEDAAHFDSYIDRTAGNLTWLAAKCLGAPGAAEGPVRAQARAAGIAGFLRAIPQLEARGRIPLIDGTPQGVRDLAQSGLDALSQARRERRVVSKQVRYALFAGWRAEATLRAARDVPERVIEGKLDESEFAKRTKLLWLSMTGRW